MTASNVQALLRSLRVFPDELPDFEPAAVPDDPLRLFLSWLDDAIRTGVPAPHTTTLATAGADGRVSARVLLLKDVDDTGWYVATHASSPKAAHIAENPQVSLSFLWSQRGRQIRIEGVASAMDAETSARDFLERPMDSRVATLVGHQSQQMADPAEYRAAEADARRRIAEDPQVVAESWTVYQVRPRSVEFWQGRPDRSHVRVRYDAVGEGWQRTMLWP
ncbi:pyridoxine/pyridoxamine 5'-phosphate oxidase [Phytoactinopolyspora limicola]|uniref:pyridoxine/pyridoxamine 5'-phosphate oxidase n=1 Tax=Phytoactinopolyspora limicola TaxID=2715536 RepID=UPI001A9C45BF|nr:pyridoxal 5'-phosphate synthase [Phytoactinopolyspora limicola]